MFTRGFVLEHSPKVAYSGSVVRGHDWRRQEKSAFATRKVRLERGKEGHVCHSVHEVSNVCANAAMEVEPSNTRSDRDRRSIWGTAASQARGLVAELPGWLFSLTRGIPVVQVQAGHRIQCGKCIGLDVCSCWDAASSK